MKLSEHKEEIYKCSGCGLCQSVCPLFNILKTECAVSRGKFKLLNAIINKHISYSKKTLEYMELCLHCQACTEFCPSGIDAQKIIETAQHDLLIRKIFSYNKFLFSRIFIHKPFLNILKFAITFIRKSKILTLLSLLPSKKIKLLNSFLNIKVNPISNKSTSSRKIKALYFKGCINNYVNPSCANAVEKILNDTSVEIINANFSCCGLPLKSIGDFEQFTKLAKQNIDAINMDFDYLIFDCASCKSTFLTYAQFLDKNYKEKAITIANKAISIYELLDKINYKKTTRWKEYAVTFHYPCHTRGTKEKEYITKILQNTPKTKFIECENANSCCGAAGSFIFTNNKLSKQISKNKTNSIIKANPNIVLTTCPACVLGLKQGLLENNSNIEVKQLIEYLAE